MSDETRAGMFAEIAAYLANPDASDRSDVEAAALAHVDASEAKDILIGRVEDLRGDPAASLAERNAAEEALASRVQAERIIEGRPLTANVGG